ncbi:hypothetical protein NDU88_008657 [Pleurodeles waltl]|uniref:Uncharacterized protein n=1 Tax=Pleurodeles waltl TaxID=8319 RepID=A0AAV7NWW4_PLEWA|nr:hypothetical protein NDU88_008657 [Pleurodeles waltl]
MCSVHLYFDLQRYLQNQADERHDILSFVGPLCLGGYTFDVDVIAPQYVLQIFSMCLEAQLLILEPQDHLLQLFNLFIATTFMALQQ